jgi:serine/threonine protein kinase
MSSSDDLLHKISAEVAFIPLSSNEFTKMVEKQVIEAIENPDDVTPKFTKSYISEYRKMYNQYIKVKELGRGSFGEVVLVENAQDGKKYV